MLNFNTSISIGRGPLFPNLDALYFQRYLVNSDFNALHLPDKPWLETRFCSLRGLKAFSQIHNLTLSRTKYYEIIHCLLYFHKEVCIG